MYLLIYKRSTMNCYSDNFRIINHRDLFLFEETMKENGEHNMKKRK